MKRCPGCSRVYDDVGLRFCLDDGTELVNKVPDEGPPATAVMPSAESVQPTLQTPPPHAAPPVPPTIAVPKKNRLPWILGAAALLLLLGAGAGVAILLLWPKQPLVVHLVLQVASPTTDREAAVTQSVAVIKSRLDALNVSNFDVKPGERGTGQILVDLPALENPERVKALIKAWGKLELVHVLGPPNPSPVQTFASQDEAVASFQNDGNVPENRRVLAYAEREGSVASDEKKWVIVASPAIVDGSELRNARAARSAAGTTDYEIQFTLKPAGAEKFGAWTGGHINEYLGIALDDEVKSIAFIRSLITDSGVITGRFTEQSAEDLALVLNSGALPGPLQFLEERVDKK